MNTLEQQTTYSYRWCYRVAKKSGSSFYRAFWLLDKPQREAMFALYAFARITDDLGDDCRSIGERTDDKNQAGLEVQSLKVRRLRLQLWRNRLLMYLGSDLPVDPASSLESSDSTEANRYLAQFDSLWPALIDTVHRYRIPTRIIQDLIDGVSSDLGRVRMPDWTALDNYCYKVASTIGLACTCIWQAHASMPKQSAIDCGIAFQLTNILRDLAEDAQRERIYIPLEELRRFGCDTSSWLAGAPNGNWLGLVEHTLQRAKDFYASGAQTIDHLPPRGKKMFWLMWSSYRELLDAIAAQPEQLWSDRRIRVSRSRRMGLLLKSVMVTTNADSLRNGR